MKQDTKNLLRDILKDNDDNDVSAVLLNLIEFEDEPDKVTYDTLFGKKPISSKDNLKSTDQTIHDERIKWLTFCNFRSVPESGEIKRYGINFAINDKPVSVFLVGSNGAGKTTLYSALEHHYISSSSLSKDMNLDEEKILTYGFGAKDGQLPTSLKISTVSGEVEERLHDHEGICSPAPFCSEYDLKQLGERGDNLTNYILEQLGYDELLSLIALLRTIAAQKNKEIKESQESHESDMSVDDIDRIINVLLKYGSQAGELLAKSQKHEKLFNLDFAEYSAGKEVERFPDLWERLRNLSAQPKKDNPILAIEKEGASLKKNSEHANELTQKLTKMYRMTEDALKASQGNGVDGLRKEIEKLYKERAPLDERRIKGILPEEEVKQIQQEVDTTEKVIRLLDDKQKSILKDFRDNRFPMIKEILKIFSNEEGELNIQEENNEGNIVLKIVVKDPINGFDDLHPTPQEYYNSFRYKLYAVSFKIALALMEMKQKGIRVPLVIDDVFNASDFENNMRLEYFAHNIYKAYEMMDNEIPLQLILLTHDEMVQTAFRKGANVLEEDCDEVRQPREYISGRLFNYRYAKQMSGELKDERTTFYNLYLQN
jgi:hypothetical protein